MFTRESVPNIVLIAPLSLCYYQSDYTFRFLSFLKQPGIAEDMKGTLSLKSYVFQAAEQIAHCHKRLNRIMVCFVEGWSHAPKHYIEPFFVRRFALTQTSPTGSPSSLNTSHCPMPSSAFALRTPLPPPPIIKLPGR